MLIPIILDKLPTEVRRNLAREQNNSEWTVENLREALLKEIWILEQRLFTHYTHSTTDSSSPITKMTTMSLYTGAKGGNHIKFDQGKQVKKFTCVHCKGTHTHLTTVKWSLALRNAWNTSRRKAYASIA